MPRGSVLDHLQMEPHQDQAHVRRLKFGAHLCRLGTVAGLNKASPRTGGGNWAVDQPVNRVKLYEQCTFTCLTYIRCSRTQSSSP